MSGHLGGPSACYPCTLSNGSCCCGEHLGSFGPGAAAGLDCLHANMAAADDVQSPPCPLGCALSLAVSSSTAAMKAMPCALNLCLVARWEKTLFEDKDKD